MNYEKPGGVMHEVIRRAFDELRLHSNAQGAVTIVTYALANAEGLPGLPSGKGYNSETVTAAPVTQTRGADGAGNGDSGSRNRSNGGGSTAAGARSSGGGGAAASMQWFTAGSIGVAITTPSTASYSPPAVTLPPGSAEWLTKRHTFNRTQLLRLLLIRCDALSVLKQHPRALQDAERAVEVSQGQSAEAYFCIGREQRRLFSIVESAAAFDTAEALLCSMQQAIAVGKPVVDGWSPETSSDEVFWADRGFQMAEVRDMGITRQEYEMQERASRRCNASPSPSGPTTPTVNVLSSGRTDIATFLMPSGGRGARTRFGAENAFNSITTPSAPGDAANSFSSSITRRSIAESGTNLTAETGGNNDDDTNGVSYVTNLLQCGMSPNELSMWRRLVSESRALLAMRMTHTVPTTVLGSTMTILDRRISGTRGGLLVSIENNTHAQLRFVGALAPDGLYHESYSFPDAILKSNSGVAMLHPKSWGGYSGSVCYELHENLCCFFYFESPLLGSLKFGVRFVDLRGSDLRRAYAEVYKETGIYGIAGGTTAAAIAPLHPQTPNPVGASGVGGSGGRGITNLVAIRGANTPLTTTVTGMNAARAAIRLPPSNTWVLAHAASVSSQRPVKATARQAGGQAMAFSVAEVLAVKLRSVELLPALEYVGAATLKKLSAVSRRYRELINNLPPPMFVGPGRRSYPDYCVNTDRYISPWIVRNRQPVVWKLSFDGRLGEQEEFSIADSEDPQKHILCFSADAQTKVTGYVYLGDKRCLQYIVKESWVPFSNTLYITTPIGRTFASCIALNNQSQYALSLTGIATHGGGMNNNSGNGGTSPSGNARGPEDVLYTARRRVPAVPISSRVNTNNSTGSSGLPGGSLNHSPIPTALVRNAEDGKGSPGSRFLGTATTPAATAMSLLDTSNSSGAYPPRRDVGVRNGGVRAVSSQDSTPSPSSLSRGLAGSVAVTATAASVSGNGRSSSSGQGTVGTVVSTSTNGAGGNAFNVTSVPSAAQSDYFTIWRSQRVSGGAVVGGGAPQQTNGGADVIAEVKVNPVLYGIVTKGYCAAEVTLYPGADALLVSLMAFLMARW